MHEHKPQPRFDGAEAWAKLTPEQQAAIGAIALEFVVNWNGLDANATMTMTPRLRPFERAESILCDMLHQTVSDAALDAYPWLHDDKLPVPIPSLLGPVCRVCGCSENDPCLSENGWACGWAENDLCTGCVAAPGGAGTPIYSDAADPPPQSTE